MIEHSKYTKIFVSNSLTRSKYDKIHAKAIEIIKFKNELSVYVNANLNDFLDMNKFEFSKFIRNNYNKIELESAFYAMAIDEVYVAYQNKFEAINNKMKFVHTVCSGFERYKRTSNGHKIGEIKKIIRKDETTPLSITLSYLAKYGRESTVDFINTSIKSADENKKKFYQNILNHIGKFGFDRLFRIAQDHKTLVMDRYSHYPIVFKSLTFSIKSGLNNLISYNKNYNSNINAFVNLCISRHVICSIPVSYSSDYHGDMKRYEKLNTTYYKIHLDDIKKQVRILFCVDGDRYLPEVSDNTMTMGIDVNIKHNLFSLSDGSVFDYDRTLLKDYCDEMTKLDTIKSRCPSYQIGKKRQAKIDKIRYKIHHQNQRIIVDVCKYLKDKHIGQVVMENLDNGFGKSFVHDSDNADINFNRIVSVLNISSLKDEFEHIARKYNIAISTVHASYTSKMCPVCGCIDDDNRKCQEHFKCVDCGHEMNADINAAINIRNRVLVTVLRNSLLKKRDNGAFEPKKMKRDKVKEVLLSFQKSLVKDRGV
jgi:transposase